MLPWEVTIGILYKSMQIITFTVPNNPRILKHFINPSPAFCDTLIHFSFTHTLNPKNI